MSVKQRVAVLDPGHFQNHNKGAAVGYYEGNWMLVYARYLEKELAALGWRVILTRYTGKDISLVDRAKVAVRYKADFFYSLHSNACSSPKVRRVTAFYSVDLPSDKALMLDLARTVAGVMGSPAYYAITRPSTTYFSKPDPSKQEDYYTVIDTAQDLGIPHVGLLEHDFHTNPDVCRWLVNRSNLQRMAKAEAAVIDRKIPAIASPTVPPSKTGGYYRVRKSWQDAASQKGAFTNLEYAKDCANENQGYSVFDDQGHAVYIGKDVR